MRYLNQFIKKCLYFLIRFYRYCISPFFGQCCRFHPSCSAYAKIAIEEHGVFYGLFLAIKRILCCHPWHKGGFDPVPPKKHEINN